MRWFTASTTNGKRADQSLPIAGEKADAHGIATGHEPVAVVLDLVNPVGAGRGFVGGGRKAGLDEIWGRRQGAYAYARSTCC